MKHIVIFFLLSLTLACGGTVEQAPEPAAPVSGPGTVATSDGISIAYTVTGHGSPALVFIHGWMCNQTFWSAQVEEFSQTNTVITIDLPGHGLSGMERDGWPLMAFGGDVHMVVEELNLAEVIVIGHSMGGPVALEAARFMPDRVIGVIGVDTLHDADFKYAPEQIKGRLAAFENDFAGTCGQFSASFFPEGTDPELVERVVSDMCDSSPEIAIAQLREFFSYEMGPALAALEVPVRYLNADTWQVNVEVNQKYQPNFDGVVMEGVGHFLMMEKPEGFNELLKQVIEGLD